MSDTKGEIKVEELNLQQYSLKELANLSGSLDEAIRRNKLETVKTDSTYVVQETINKWLETIENGKEGGRMSNWDKLKLNLCTAAHIMLTLSWVGAIATVPFLLYAGLGQMAHKALMLSAAGALAAWPLEFYLIRVHDEIQKESDQ